MMALYTLKVSRQNANLTFKRIPTPTQIPYLINFLTYSRASVRRYCWDIGFIPRRITGQIKVTMGVHNYLQRLK